MNNVQCLSFFFLVNYYVAMVSIKLLNLEDDLYEMALLEIKKPKMLSLF